jgi:hypothetical protein
MKTKNFMLASKNLLNPSKTIGDFGKTRYSYRYNRLALSGSKKNKKGV